MAARAQTDTANPDLAGLEQIGIFAARGRGEVFLTESDLERFLKFDASIALVVAGSKAGFFVRENDGSIQSIRSYQEFPLAGDALPRFRLQSWMILAAALVTLFFLARADWSGWLLRPAESLTIRRDAGQLRIAWNPAAVGKGDQMEILEGAQETRIPLPATLGNATYIPRTEDAEVRIFMLDAHAQPRREIALFLGNQPADSPEIETIRAEIESLEAEAGALRTTFESRQKRLVALEQSLNQQLRAR